MRIIPTILLIAFFSSDQLFAHPSWGIVVDAQKNIYFPDIAHHGGAVWKLAPNGKLQLLIDHFHAHNVSLDADGNLITAHGEGNHTMIRIHPDGAIDTLFHTFEHNQFFGGNCAWTPQGEIIYGTREHPYLTIIDRNGKHRPAGDHPFGWNQTIYPAADGSIYAPDISIDNGVVVKINRDGTSEIIARDLISRLDRPKDKHNDVLLGIGQDGEGIIYIAEIAGQRIIRIPEKGKAETYYTSAGDWFPAGITFFEGEAYILEFRHTRSGMEGPKIVRLDRSGQTTELFNYETYEKGTLVPPAVPGSRRPLLPLLTGAALLVVLFLWIRRKRYAAVALSLPALFLTITACSAPSEPGQIRKLATEYFQTYQERTDFQKLLSYYSEEAVLEDMIGGFRITGKDEIAGFLDWEHPDFGKLSSKTLVVTQQIVEGNKVVTSGYFNPFQWKETKIEAMQFTTLLTFNEAGKIVKHVDWINYPSYLMDYQQRANSNQWIPK